MLKAVSSPPNNMPFKQAQGRDLQKAATQPTFQFFQQQRGATNSLSIQNMAGGPVLPGRFSSTQSVKKLLQDRPQSQQLQPWDEQNRRASIEEKLDNSRSRRHFCDFSGVDDSDEEDSCDANADERESVKLTDEFDIGADHHKNQRRHRWDYFSMGDNMSSVEERDNFSSNYPEDHKQLNFGGHQFNSTQQIRQRQLMAISKTPSREGRFSYSPPNDSDRILKRMKSTRLQQPQSSKLCELLRSDRQDKPNFVQPSSKGSPVRQQSPANQSARNTFYKPSGQVSANNFFLEGTARKRKQQRMTQNFSPDGSSFVLLEQKKKQQENKRSLSGLEYHTKMQQRFANQFEKINNNSKRMFSPATNRKIQSKEKNTAALSSYQLQPRKIMAEKKHQHKQQQQKQPSNFFDHKPQQQRHTIDHRSSIRDQLLNQPSFNQETRQRIQYQNQRHGHERVNSPAIQPDDHTNNPSQSQLFNRNIVQVDNNYFDHMMLPGTMTSSSSEAAENMYTPDIARRKNPQLHLSEQMPSKRREAQHASFINLRQNRSSLLDHITETNNDKSVNSCNKGELQFAPVVPVNVGAQHQLDQQKLFIQMPNHFRKSFQDVDYANSSTHDEASHRNLMGSAFLKYSASPISSIIQEQNKQADIGAEGVASVGSGTPSVGIAGASANSRSPQDFPTPQRPIRPIVPKEDYLPTQEDEVTSKFAASKPQEAPAQMHWLTGLAVSVSQLFAGTPTQATQPDVEESKESISGERGDRRLSSNGEVPDDEEDNLGASIQLTNADVINEQTRVHQGNTVRKKILFMESGVTKKGAAGRREGATSLKASLISAQSYNQIDSGSDEPEEESRSSAIARRIDRENAISYTTSKGGSSPAKGVINNMNVAKRPHSNSVQESFSSIGTGFSNLASNVFRQSQKGGLQDSPDSPKSPQSLAVNLPAQKESKAQNDAINSARFGILSYFFDRGSSKTPKKDGDIEDEDSSMLKKNQETSEQDDHFAPLLDDHSPNILGQRKTVDMFTMPWQKSPKNDDDDQLNQKPQYGRPASKTVHFGHQRPPILSQSNTTQQLPQTQPPEERLRQIDNIVFNQDKSHFAVIWTDGGFTKFDVATLQVVQRVNRTPPPGKPGAKDDEAAEITLASANMAKKRALGNMRVSKRRSAQKGEEADVQSQDENEGMKEFEDEIEDDEDEEVENDQFLCVALQHRTKDYLATLVRNPNMIIFVHVQDDLKSKKKERDRKKKLSRQLGHRTHVKHFQEEVSQIEILPEARFTVICLKTAIYIYSKNSRDLFDIVPCSSPVISSAIYKRFADTLVLAYLSQDDPLETVHVHDYQFNATTQKDTIFTIDKPFTKGYKVGGIQLDELGQRLVVVSADGCYIYLYCLEEEQKSEQVGQDQAIPEEEGQPSVDQSQDATSSQDPNLAHSQTSFGSHEVIIKSPQQQFARSSSSCKTLFKPIQIIEGFSMKEHICDFILLSTSSMTSHMFVVKSAEELEESQAQQQQSWNISRFLHLPASFSLERSKIRLNILEELAPVPTPNPRADSRANQQAAQPESQGQNVYKKQLKEYPYTCFVESSGLMVVISYSGYCCKYSIDLQHELPQFDIRNSGYHSVRGARLSPKNRFSNQVSLSQVDLGQSLAQLKEVEPKKRIGQSKEKRLDLSLATSTVLDTTPGTQVQLASMQSQTTTGNQAAAMKRATAFSGFKQPRLNIKFKIEDFFVKIDLKAESLRRIRKREILKHRTSRIKERAFFLSQMQGRGRARLERAGSVDERGTLLKKLLRGNQMLSQR